MKLARGWLIAFSIGGALIAIGWIGALSGISGRGVAIGLTVVAVLLVAAIGVFGQFEKRDHDRS